MHFDEGNKTCLRDIIYRRRDYGAAAVHACCTHAILSDKAVERVNCSPLRSLVITDTIPLPPHKRSPKIKVLSVAPLLAQAILRIHEDNSVSELFQHYANH